MSVQAVAHVLATNRVHRGAARLVLLVLAEHAHADGTEARPSLTTIAAESGVHRGTVPEVLQGLEADGAIARAGVGYRGVIVYRVDLEWIGAPTYAGKPTRNRSALPTSDQPREPTSRESRPVGDADHNQSGTPTRTTQEPNVNSSPLAPQGGEQRPLVALARDLAPQALELPASPAHPGGKRDRDRAKYREACRQVNVEREAFASEHFTSTELAELGGPLHAAGFLGIAAGRLRAGTPATAENLRDALHRLGYLGHVDDVEAVA